MFEAKSLNRVWGMYFGGFLGTVVVLGVLEQLGVLGSKGIGYGFMGLTIGVYALIGIISRTSKLDEYYVAGRSVPGVYNGMATASDWMSAASFISMAGSIYALGYDGLLYVMGWTGGYVLLAVFLAPYLRKFGAYTVPDFMAARYGGNVARVIAICTTIFLSTSYLVAQVVGVGMITSRFLGLQFQVGVFVGLGGILVCSFLGGMRAVTWTQVAQYIILITAYIIPVAALSYKFTGVPIPELMYGQALQAINKLEQGMGLSKLYIQPFTTFNQLAVLASTLCLMAGTAGLPHVLVRFYTVPSVRESRYSVGWALFFIFLLYFTAPAYAAFARWEILQNVVGKKIAELPPWVASWAKVGVLKIDDKNKDGILQFGDFLPSPDMIVLATPEIAGLPYVISGLIAAGGLAAALSTADGLLMAVSTSLSHDLYYKIINPKASDQFRLTMSKVLLIVFAAFAAYLATLAQKIALIVQIVGWVFSLAAASFFPALTLGVWNKRINATGAMTGLIVGFGVTLAYIIANVFYKFNIAGIPALGAGIFGMPLNFILAYVISNMTAAPPQRIQDLVTNIRFPKRFSSEVNMDTSFSAPPPGH